MSPLSYIQVVVRDVAVKVVNNVAVKRSKNCENFRLEMIIIAITHRNHNATTTSVTVAGPQDTTDPNCTDGKHKLSMYQVKNTVVLLIKPVCA